MLKRFVSFTSSLAELRDRELWDFFARTNSEKRVLVAFSALALAVVGMAFSYQAGAQSEPSGQVCADKIARAISSPDATVAGSFSCLSSVLQETVIANVGRSGDAALRPATSVFTSYRVLGQLSDGGYVYSVSGPGGSAALVVWVIGGKVSAVSIAAQ